MNIHSCARTSVRGRELLVFRVTEEGWTVGEAAEAAGVSPRTVYKWLERFDAEGPAGLLDRSSRPKRSPTAIPRSWQELILQLRRSRMTAAAISARIKIPKATVARVLKRHGLERLKKLDPPVPVRRYERSRPGELVHLDVKKLGRFRVTGHRVTGVRNHAGRGLGIGEEGLLVQEEDQVGPLSELEPNRTPAHDGLGSGQEVRWEVRVEEGSRTRHRTHPDARAIVTPI